MFLLLLYLAMEISIGHPYLHTSTLPMCLLTALSTVSIPLILLNITWLSSLGFHQKNQNSKQSNLLLNLII